MSKTWIWLVGGLAAAAVVLTGAVAWLNVRGEEPIDAAAAVVRKAPAAADDAQWVARGEYLARAGNCISCHTAAGGPAYAGGRPIETPFGAVYASNLTPDPATGIGQWTPAHFWRALHHGRSKDGRLLYPAFPYTSYTYVTREDADAIYAFLQSLPPVAQAVPAHTLRFPYNTQAALAVWRALFFAPADPARQAGPPGATPSATVSEARGAPAADIRRGAYLVEGLGHCSACHTARNAFGATVRQNTLGGGLIPLQNWYAPALNAPEEAGVAHWPRDDVVALLHTGVSSRGSVAGPMAEVVFNSTQYLDAGDVRAMAAYLQSLPERPPEAVPPWSPPVPAVVRQGGEIYAQQCAQCHGDAGQGQSGAFPALAGNRAVTLPRPTNVLQLILHGGYLPATAGNPQPHGMPPFVQTLDDAEIAAVATYIRSAWGNRASPVGAVEVFRIRSGF